LRHKGKIKYVFCAIRMKIIIFKTLE